MRLAPGVHSRPAHSRRHLYVTSYTEGFSHFVTSMTAPVASGWSVRRVGLSPTGKRRLLTAHANSGHRSVATRAFRPRAAKRRVCPSGRAVVKGTALHLRLSGFCLRSHHYGRKRLSPQRRHHNIRSDVRHARQRRQTIMRGKSRSSLNQQRRCGADSRRPPRCDAPRGPRGAV